jgi:hypothetical protein
MLNTQSYQEEKVRQALGILLVDRRNEFRELGSVLLSPGALSSMPHWEEFVLNFCLDVEESFKTWSGKLPLLKSSPQKALTILRQLSRGRTSMNQLAHFLNISYNLSAEFKEIYRRLR